MRKKICFLLSLLLLIAAPFGFVKAGECVYEVDDVIQIKYEWTDGKGKPTDVTATVYHVGGDKPAPMNSYFVSFDKVPCK